MSALLPSDFEQCGCKANTHDEYRHRRSIADLETYKIEDQASHVLDIGCPGRALNVTGRPFHWTSLDSNYRRARCQRFCRTFGILYGN